MKDDISIAAGLRVSLAELDRAYNRKRQALLNALEAFGEEVDGPGQRSGGRASTGTATGAVSTLRDVIREYMKQNAAPFDKLSISKFGMTHHPLVASKHTMESIASTLRKMAALKEIAVVTPGSMTQPTTYQKK
jgi:hypothetical protein